MKLEILILCNNHSQWNKSEYTLNGFVISSDDNITYLCSIVRAIR